MKHDTIGYHTALDLGTPDEIFRNAPFYSENKKDKSFLSDGYYFWELDIERAKAFGNSDHFKNEKFVIIEFKITLEKMLDLCGNIQHMNELLQLQNTLKDMYPKLKGRNLPLSKTIRLLKELNKLKEGIFTYDSIRARYEDQKEIINLKFTKSLSYITNLHPRIIICVFENKPSNLQPVKFVYPIEYAN